MVPSAVRRVAGTDTVDDGAVHVERWSACEAEVEELRPCGRQHHVARFEVAMCDARPVSVIERVDDLGGVAQDVGSR